MSDADGATAAVLDVRDLAVEFPLAAARGHAR